MVLSLKKWKTRCILSAEWSNNDDSFLEDAIHAAKETYSEHCGQEELVDWLKSLKDRVQPQNLTVTDEELAQAKKNAYNDALDKIEYHSGNPTFDDGWSAAIWYLKKRNVQPQNRWKPSERQIYLLNWVANILLKDDGIVEKETAKELRQLLEQLKKLKGE